MTTQEVINDAQERMNKTIAVMQHELSTLKAGRANPQILERITVDYYGTQTPITQVGNVSAPEPRVLTIAVWEASMLKAVEKAIQQSDLGINPTNDGKIIRLIVPELTTERRKELVKVINNIAEESRVAVRSIRRDAMDKMKKAEKKSEITEDDLKKGESSLQKITDAAIKSIDDMSKAKEKEIMSI